MRAYIEEMKLVGRATYAVGEEEHIALQPGDFLGWELVAGTGRRHFQYIFF